MSRFVHHCRDDPASRGTLLLVSFAPRGGASPSSTALSVLHSAIWSRYANSSNDLTLRTISDLRNRRSHSDASSFSSFSAFSPSFPHRKQFETHRTKSRRWRGLSSWLRDFPDRWKLASLNWPNLLNACCWREHRWMNHLKRKLTGNLQQQHGNIIPRFVTSL